MSKQLALPTSDLEIAFVREFMVDFNPARAYMRAQPGCSERTAYANAKALLAKQSVHDYMASVRDDLEQVAGISRLRVLKEFMKIGFSSIADMHMTWIDRKDFEKLTPEQRSCIQEIDTQVRQVPAGVDEEGNRIYATEEKIKIKLYSKQTALDSICKMLGYDVPLKQLNDNERQKVGDLFGPVEEALDEARKK